MSEAVVAPDCSMTSGATVRKLSLAATVKGWSMRFGRTPVGTANYGIVTDRACGGAACNSEVGQFDASVLVRQNVRTLDIPVYHALVMKVHEPL